jgi:hypothetical protein
MAIDSRTPMARHMLDDRKYAAIEKTLDRPSTKLADEVGLSRKGTITDRLRLTVDTEIKHRRTIDGNAERFKISGNQPCMQPSGFLGEIQAPVRKRADLSKGRESLPMGRLQPCDATAFLIDQDGCMGIIDRSAKVTNERPYLIGMFTISRKENEARRPFPRKQLLFFSRQAGAGCADNRGGLGPGVLAFPITGRQQNSSRLAF